jgi:hypothetical protein
MSVPTKAASKCFPFFVQLTTIVLMCLLGIDRTNAKQVSLRTNRITRTKGNSTDGNNEPMVIPALTYVGEPPLDPVTVQYGACQGRCNASSQCKTGLSCIQRVPNDLVISTCLPPSPSNASNDTTANGTVISNTLRLLNYCAVVPDDELVTVTRANSTDNSVAITQRCSGGCILDDDCLGDHLKCSLPSHSSVPGCVGYKHPSVNYCYYDNSTEVTTGTHNSTTTDQDESIHNSTTATAPVPSPSTKTYLQYVGEPPYTTMLSECQGDCDSDWHCDYGLNCFKRSNDKPIPGCTSSGDKDDIFSVDYCYKPPTGTLVIVQDVRNNDTTTTAEKCQGNCITDDECNQGLKCFQRQNYEPVPGCKGLGAHSTNYCYNPADDDFNGVGSTSPVTSTISNAPSITTTLSPSVVPTLKSGNIVPVPTVTDTMSPTIAKAMPSVSPLSVESPSTNPTVPPTTLPSIAPFMRPSNGPSNSPTLSPSQSISMNPSNFPSWIPIAAPSHIPSDSPILFPSSLPTILPSDSTATSPSRIPTNIPSDSPATSPSHTPSLNPSVVPPTLLPETSFPTVVSGIVVPRDLPTLQPSILPSVSVPSENPSFGRSDQPSEIPTGSLSYVPSDTPTLGEIVNGPSTLPSAFVPSENPSLGGFDQPSEIPSVYLSYVPSDTPTIVDELNGVGSREPPTVQPTTVNGKGTTASEAPKIPPISHQPVFVPSASPFSQPSHAPSLNPTSTPSSTPSLEPSSHPSISPSLKPSIGTSDVPSHTPSVDPSLMPSESPSDHPSMSPSTSPTQQPSDEPSLSPSSLPSLESSTLPTIQPSDQPSMSPSTSPTKQPSDEPSISPSSLPSLESSTLPTIQPSDEPSDNPTSHPNSEPSETPSSGPSSLPSLQPSSTPVAAPSAVPSASDTVTANDCADLSITDRATAIYQRLVHEFQYGNNEIVVSSNIAANNTNLKSSYQQLAYDWIVNTDEQVNCPNTTKLMQRYVLAAFWFACDGEGWTMKEEQSNQFLSATVDECQWYGISCEDDENISAFHLDESNITGTLPDELAFLNEIRELNIDTNQIVGSIPTWFNRWTKLEILDLDHNGLTGSIPSSLYTVSTLRVLDLDSNSLTGTISAEGIENWADTLYFLQLDFNQIVGTIPSILGQFTNLQYLSLFGNNFTNTLLSSIDNLCDGIVTIYANCNLCQNSTCCTACLDI